MLQGRLVYLVPLAVCISTGVSSHTQSQDYQLEIVTEDPSSTHTAARIGAIKADYYTPLPGAQSLVPRFRTPGGRFSDWVRAESEIPRFNPAANLLTSSTGAPSASGGNYRPPSQLALDTRTELLAGISTFAIRAIGVGEKWVMSRIGCINTATTISTMENI